MEIVGFIPVRKGSKGVSGKNKRNFCGRPLYEWQLLSMLNSESFTKICISTDDPEIKKQVKENYGSSVVRIHNRSRGVSNDLSSTEEVILEFLCGLKIDPESVFVLGQATNPFIQAKDYRKALIRYAEILNTKGGDVLSMLSVSETERFFWSNSVRDYGTALNYDPENRKRRQDYESGIFIENGGFYVNLIKNILSLKNRLTKSAILYKMPSWTNFEIDDPLDWKICELVFRGKILNEKT